MKTIIKYTLIYFTIVSLLFANYAQQETGPVSSNTTVENPQENQQEEKETSVEKEKDSETTKKEESSTALKGELEQCIENLNSADESVIMDSLKNCALNNKENEKIQDALIGLIENKNHLQIIKSSMLLLANQKSDKIAERLSGILNSDKFNNDSLVQYIGTVVLYSVKSDKNKEKSIEVYQKFSSSEDELLKNLAENLLKQNQ